ncbi:MAG: hypothetical protein PHQ23_15440, partial [Candidatus Wallbacteria bacterium]|nr:hypothetical protein [Candidatus Wallbacteria bacterium]
KTVRLPERIRSRILIAGCTHREDEEIVFSALSELLKSGIGVFIAPRNIVRCDEVIRRGKELGFDGLKAGTGKGRDFTVIDSMGVLDRYYSDSEWAFVGGTFKDLGGHNIMEPAQSGCRVLFGPFIRNFAQEAAELIRLGIGLKIENADDLAAALNSLEHPDWEGFAELLAINQVCFENLVKRVGNEIA